MLLSNVNEAYVLENQEAEDAAANMSDDDLATLEALMLEGCLLEDGINRIITESAETVGLTPVEEASIVKLDRQAKKNRDYKFAILKCARIKGDKKVKQLMTLWKMEAFLMRDLEKRYGNKAKAMMKKTASEAKKHTKTATSKGLLAGHDPLKKLGEGIKPGLKKGATRKSGYAGKPPAKLKQEVNMIGKKLQSKIKN